MGINHKPRIVFLLWKGNKSNYNVNLALEFPMAHYFDLPLAKQYFINDQPTKKTCFRYSVLATLLFSDSYCPDALLFFSMFLKLLSHE